MSAELFKSFRTAGIPVEFLSFPIASGAFRVFQMDIRSSACSSWPIG